MRRITEVEVLGGYTLKLSFDNGISGVADLSALVGKGVFALWNNEAAFRSFQIGSSGELTWGGQVDLCPDALYMKVTGQKPQDIFPALRTEAAHA